MSLLKPYQIRSYPRELYLKRKEAQHRVSMCGNWRDSSETWDFAKQNGIVARLECP